MISVSNLSKSFGSHLLFEDASFNVARGQRVGLVGRNGTGKSTLFKILLDLESRDNGEIKIPKGYRLGSLDQHIHFTYSNVLDECVESLPEAQQYDIFRIEKILFGLGFSDEDLQKDPKSFSGGYQVRINLAKALLQDPDLLLLDEPTNYLDIVSLDWLKDFLKKFQGEVILITHDREFMDSVCTHIIGIHHQKIKKIQGSTEKFYQQIAEEEIVYEQTRLNQEKKAKEIQDFVDRFRAKASKAKQAQSRLKMLSRMNMLTKNESDSDFGFKFHYKEFNAKNIASIDNLSFGYGVDVNLFENLNFSISKNDRIAIIGKNGKGKSTLLNVLAGFLQARTGSVKFHNDTAIGHFGQTNIKRLHDTNTIAQEISSSNLDLSQTAVRNICGCMMFEGDKADKPISVLSGGEKARVMLGKILATPSNLLFLDEPTNHLDMESIEVLCEEIDSFPGAVVLVTHSELLLKKLVNKLIIFKNNKAEFFLGDYADFLKKVGWDEGYNLKEVNKPQVQTIGYREKKKLKSKIISERSRECGEIKESIEKLENEIVQLEELLDRFNGLIQDKVDNGEDAIELMEQVRLLHEKIEDKFSELELKSDQHGVKWQHFENQLNELGEVD